MATDKETLLSCPPRRHDLLSELLVRVIEHLDPQAGPEVAEDIGRSFGRDLAAEIGLAGGNPDDAVSAVAGALSAVGFGISESATEDALVTDHCPFGETAADHPEVVCRIDQGIVKGLMEVAGGQGDAVVVSPHQGPDEACLTEV